MEHEKPQRILVCRTDRIGDVVLTLPLLRAVRAAFPRATIGALVAPATAPLLDGNPDVDVVLHDDARGIHRGLRGFLALAKAVRALHFDAVLLPYGTWRVASLALSARIRRRIGNGFRAYLPLLNRPVWLHRRHPPVHEAVYCLRFLEGLGIEPPAKPSLPRLFVTEPERLAAGQFLAAKGLKPGQRLLGVHPGSGASAFNMSPDRWVRAARLAAARIEADRVVITGSVPERALAERLANALGKTAVIAAGEVDLRGLLALQERMALVLGPSTGPLHTAAALGTPVLGFFPPLGSMSAAKWAPMGARVAVVTPEPGACPRCPRDKCPRWPCMDGITDDAIQGALAPLLDR